MNTLSDASRAGHTRSAESASTIVRSFTISLGATLVFMMIVLVSAGRFWLWQAWVYGALSLGLNIGQRVILRADPELAKERAKPGADARASDKVLLGIGLVLTLGMLVTAGLQFRFGTAPSLSLAWFVAGLVLDAAGALLFLWAMRENSFFSAVVRVQHDRRQSVCTTGPYRFVRHPGNLGMIIGTLGFPLLFQSTWSFIPAGLSIIALSVRTQLEDAYLTRELEGYAEYRKRTRFRIVPGLW